MTTSHIYPGSASLNAYITINGCAEAIEFYKKAFDASVIGILKMPDGTIGHAEISIEGTMLMMADENLDWGNKGPNTIGGNPLTLSIYVPDVDISFQKAIDAGATVVMPVEDMFYGDRVGQVMDPFGYKWMIATNKEVVTFEEMQKRSDEIFSSM